MECSIDKIPFLDVLVQMKNTDEPNSFIVHTDIYKKKLIYLTTFPLTVAHLDIVASIYEIMNIWLVGMSLKAIVYLK